MTFLILGATGMAGHLITHYLREQSHEVTPLSRRDFHFDDTVLIDAENFSELREIIAEGRYDYVVNCIGILNRDAEEHKSSAVRLNSELPHFLAEITVGTGTRVIHLSTDCVFSGTNTGGGENMLRTTSPTAELFTIEARHWAS